MGRRRVHRKAPKPSRRAEESRPPGAARIAAAPPADSLAGPPYLWGLAALLTTWGFGYTAMLNSDLWFHLAAGRAIVQDGEIPRVDSWSYTAFGDPWHNHEWLSGVVFHGWSALFGVESLVYWKWLLLATAFGLLFAGLVRVTGRPVASYLATLSALALAAPFFDIRPHLYTLVAVSALLYIGLTRRRLPWALPLLFLIWINLHGGAVLGLMIVGLLVTARVVTRKPGEAAGLRRDGLVFLGCGGASLVNPFGVSALLYPFRLALGGGSASRRHIYEWASPFIEGGIQSPLYPWALAWAATATMLLLRRGVLRGPGAHVWWTVLVFAAVTVAMSLQSRRFIVLFALAQAYLVAPVLPDPLRWARWRDRAAPVRGRLLTAAALVTIAVALVRLVPYPWGPEAFAPLTRLHRMPVAAVDFVEANDLDGKVFSYFLWGGYLHHRTAGDLRVFLDPRSETVFSDRTQRSYYHVHQGKSGWRSVIDASGAEMILWPVDGTGSASFVRHLAASGRWRLVHRDARAALLVRSDRPLPLTPVVPDTAQGRLAKAREAARANRLDAAHGHLEAALEKEPTLRAACTDLVLVQAARADRGALLDTARRCQKIFPDRAEWRRHKRLAEELPVAREMG